MAVISALRRDAGTLPIGSRPVAAQVETLTMLGVTTVALGSCMADYPDLGHESPAVSGQGVRAIGWLEPDQPIPTGVVPAAFRDKLKRDLARATPTLATVAYGCALCDDPHYDKRELFIPAGPLLYAAPPEIGHYIDEHGYRPPDEFIRAVEASPPVGSLRYRLVMLRHAGLWALWPTIVTRPVFLAGILALVPFVRLFRRLTKAGKRRGDGPFA